VRGARVHCRVRYAGTFGSCVIRLGTACSVWPNRGFESGLFVGLIPLLCRRIQRGSLPSCSSMSFRDCSPPIRVHTHAAFSKFILVTLIVSVS
jgi:hypothetical protein